MLKLLCLKKRLTKILLIESERVFKKFMQMNIIMNKIV